MHETMPHSPCAIKLKNRGLIILSGADTRNFLQAVITNDMNKLTSGTMLYACLLTPQGKFLHDFFLTQHEDDIWLECEGGERTEDLARRLSLYKLRKDVRLTVKTEQDVYAVLGHDGFGFKDPRHTDLGYRSYEKPDLPESDFDTWDYVRIGLAIPDGSRDLSVEKSTLDEARMDTLHAVDYKKGCYIGQELTARMHYRGLGKKHLACIPYPPVEADNVIEIRSSCKDRAIALVKTAKL